MCKVLVFEFLGGGLQSGETQSEHGSRRLKIELLEAIRRQEVKD